ncbi:MAG: ribulose-phosphate 3-epimerase [Thermodesulfobacteriota bacterium]|jgi:ribulose-phosphate 3-epimerase|nr:MAG: ribulose-phosphate 3-epimerase [Thermodesulfobacteriota bacterium]
MGYSIKKIIAPSILSADFSRLGEEIAAIEKGGADWVHVDVMDGHFVPNITIGPPVVASLRKITRLPLDVHLMIQDPDKYIEKFAKAGADIITVHVETSPHLHRSVQFIKDQGCKAGVSLNPATSLTMLDHILSEVDMVLIMTVNPGFGGQEFISSVLPKIKHLWEKIREKGIGVDIEVDGGVNLNTISKVAQAGGNIFVAGNAVFTTPDYGKTISELRRLAE